MHAQLDARLGAARQAEQLDAVAELLRVADIDRLQLGDALHIGALELHRHAEGDGAHQRELVGGIEALDVEGRIGLGIAQALGLREHRAEVQALVAHLRQDEVGGAVDDAGDPLDAVTRQPLAQRLDDGDAAGHRGLERHHHALVLGGLEDLVAVHRQQRLVGRDHVLAVGDGAQHQFARQVIAADQLHHDVDLGRIHHRNRVVHHRHARAGFLHDGAGALDVAHRNQGDLDAAPGAAPDFFLVPLQNLERTATDGTEPEQADLDGFHETCCKSGKAKNGQGRHFGLPRNDGSGG